MTQESSKRIREKAQAIQEIGDQILTLRIDEKRNAHKFPLHLHKRDAVIQECTENYVNFKTLDSQPRVVHTEWAPGVEEEKVLNVFPGKELSIPLEDIKIARDLEKDRLMIIISREVWDVS
ncbi:MAG: hypothetical protein O7F12_05395 [Nitrospirae bacterium]|jgi:hypothetical protein|nr:hypothetical protein [Nitrospirota bacterium]